MRLLNVHTLELNQHPPEARPPYVVASHRWVEDETTYKDVVKRRNTDKAGYKKVLGFAGYVRQNLPLVDWLWIDTCCIDKTNKTELEYAINSMFQWYRAAQICIAFLADVLEPHDSTALQDSVWFKRGWTLQELIAPDTVVFLTRNWRTIGYKGAVDSPRADGPRLNSIIASITGISEAVLEDYNKSKDLSADDKMVWITGRTTTYEEDLAYCMLGILDISMRISYGSVEAKKAMARLRAKIKKSSMSAEGREQIAAVTEVEKTTEQWSQASTDSSMDNADLPLVLFIHTQTTHELGFVHVAKRLAELAKQLNAFGRRMSNASAPLERLSNICEGASTLFRRLESFSKESTVNIELLMECIQAYGMNLTSIFQTIDGLDARVKSLLDNSVLSTNQNIEIDKLADDLQIGRTLLQLALSLYTDKMHTLRLSRSTRQSSGSRMSPELGNLASTQCRPTLKGRSKRRRLVLRTTANWGWLSSKVWSLSVMHAHSG